jgi:hypothetical protein
LIEEIHRIEDKIQQEIDDKDVNKQQSCTDPEFITPSELETMKNFYYRLQVKPYTDTSETTATRYAAHYKLFIDQLIDMLVKNGIIASTDYETISRIISREGSEGAYEGKLGRMDKGLSTSTLAGYYSAIWWEIESKDTLQNNKEKAMREVDTLFYEQYTLYGHTHENPLFWKIKHSYLKLVMLSYKAGKISFSQDSFNSKYHFRPRFQGKDSQYKNTKFIPKKETWESLGNRIINDLDPESIYPTIVRSIIEDITDVIINQRKLQNLLDEKIPNANLPQYRAKRALIEAIINCPDTDVLKIPGKVNVLDYLLFNHPSYSDQKSYLAQVYFRNPGWHLDTVEALLSRISSLEVSDFREVGLGDYIDSSILSKLKDHAEREVWKFIEENNINNYELVGITYQTKGLRDLQLEAIRALWKAGAKYIEDPFASYPKALAVFGIKEDNNFYYRHVTFSRMLGIWRVNNLLTKLDKLIFEQAASVIFPSYPFSYSAIVNLDSTDSFFTNSKLEALIDAKEKLIRYQEAKLKAREVWKQSDTVVKSWFEKLFQPFLSGYTHGFKNDPLYRGFMVTMGLCDLFGTDPLSGDPIPDNAFKKGDLLQYADHHDESADKMLMHLYDISLTFNRYHPFPMESLSSTDLKIIKNGLRQLLEIGISREVSINGQWVTEADFKRIFPEHLKFKFSYDGDNYVSLYDAWANIFDNYNTFDKKLDTINDKIQEFKDAIQRGDNPFLAVIHKFSPSAEVRFWYNAEQFMKNVMRFITDDLFTEHSIEDLAFHWQMYWAQKIFGIR